MTVDYQTILKCSSVACQLNVVSSYNVLYEVYEADDRVP